MLKRVIQLSAIFVAFALLLSPIGAAEEGSNIMFNDNPLQGKLIFEEGKTFVPLRAVAEAWGAQVDFWEKEQKVIVRKEGNDFSFVIGEDTGVFNGQPVELVSPARIIEERTFLETGILEKLFNWKTRWNEGIFYISTDETLLLSKTKVILDQAGEEKEISYYVTQNPDGMPLYWTLKVDDRDIICAGNDEGYFSHSRLDFKDVDGDGLPEVLLYRYNTGSAGGQGIIILKPQEGNWTEILSVGQFNQVGTERFQMEYLGDYKVSFLDRISKLQSYIPLEREKYQGMEELLEGIDTWVDPVSEIVLADLDNDGIQEVVTLQRVIGVSHVDTIATWRTTYELENGCYKAAKVSLMDNREQVLAQVSLAVSK